MKKIEVSLFIISILFGCLLSLSSCSSDKTRIRIVSNDNSSESLNEKLLVKDEVLKLLQKTSKLNEMELVKYLDENLKKKFTNYKVEYIYDTYPAKRLNGNIIPSGTYPTIRITLGSGNGSNWWSILYPEYFNLDYDNTGEVEYRSYFYDLFSNSK